MNQVLGELKNESKIGRLRVRNKKIQTMWWEHNRTNGHKKNDYRFYTSNTTNLAWSSPKNVSRKFAEESIMINMVRMKKGGKPEVLMKTHKTNECMMPHYMIYENIFSITKTSCFIYLIISNSCLSYIATTFLGEIEFRTLSPEKSPSSNRLTPKTVRFEMGTNFHFLHASFSEN